MGGRGDGSGREAWPRARGARQVAAVLVLGMLVAIGSLSASKPAQAGAWTLPAGEGQVIVQTTAATSSQEFGPASDLLSSRPYEKAEVDLVFEYGAADWLTLIAAPQFLAVHLGAPGSASYAGPGYTSLGARVRLYESGSFVVSAQAVARISGTGSSQSAAAVGYEDGELDLRLLAGWSFMLLGKSAYFDLQAAQRQRSGPPPDEFHLDATLGIRVAERWQVLVQSFNVVSEGAGEGPYFGASYEYYKLQLGAAYDWSKTLTLQLSVVGTYFARNAPQENGLVLSAQYRF
ncbi:hypothetical protein [Xanthobacter pseudotagetidis]|uniref:hypothetical protein n=1 Tax=Xanthobacter pseudotagetidis TaxID=3119911 RepID=UPI00372BEC22